MSAPRFSPLAVAGVLALLLLSALVAAPAAPAVAPNMQAPPTLTPTPTPTPIPRTGGRIGPGRSSGDPHLRTPDGFAYDFQAAGEFIALMSRVDDLAVQIRQEPVGASTVASMNTAVATNVVGDRVGVYVGTQPALWVNGQPTTLGNGSLPLPRGGRVEQQGSRYVIVWPDQSVVEVTLRSQFLDVVVRLAPARQAQVAGLFGNADGGAANDLTTREGTVVDLTGLAAEALRARLYGEFGNSWRISQAESLFDYGPGEDADTFARLDFPSVLITASDLAPTTRGVAEAVCRGAGVTEADVLADCVLDIGVTGDAEFAASAAEVQAAVVPGAALEPPVAPAATLVQGVYQGQITDTTLCTLYTAGDVDAKMKSSDIQISLDPASGLVTGGSLSYEVDITSMKASDLSLNPNMMEVTDVCSFTSTQPATGIVVSFPDGAGGHVDFISTRTYQLGRWAEMKEISYPPMDPVNGINTWPNELLNFGFVIDATGQQLMLCPYQEDSVTMSPDAQTRQTCAATAVAVLQRIP